MLSASKIILTIFNKPISFSFYSRSKSHQISLLLNEIFDRLYRVMKSMDGGWSSDFFFLLSRSRFAYHSNSYLGRDLTKQKNRESNSIRDTNCRLPLPATIIVQRFTFPVSSTVPTNEWKHFIQVGIEAVLRLNRRGI